MTDYTHAISSERNEGLVDTLSQIPVDDGVLDEDNAEDSELPAKKIRQLIRTDPEGVLWNTSEGVERNATVEKLKGGHPKQIRELRSEDEGTLISATVQVDYVSQPFAHASEIDYICTSCGRLHQMPQDTKTKYTDEPSVCHEEGCQNKHFAIDGKNRVNKQLIKISDLTEGKQQPAETFAHVYGEHIGTIATGDTLQFSGIVKHIQTNNKKSELKEKPELVLTHAENQERTEVELEREDIDWIESLENPVEQLVQSIAPHLVGVDDKKRGLLHVLCTGHSELDDIRAKSHALNIGDPSTGKSDLLEWFNDILPKSMIGSAETASGVGLTAVAEREERVDGKWIVKAGMLPKAHEGHAFLDEMGEFTDQEINKLRTTLATEEVRLTKAAAGNPPASTRFVGAANPEDGKFNRYKPPKEQFDFPHPILERMDLIYVWRDTTEDDDAIADAITNKYVTTTENASDCPLTEEQVQKYIYYVLNEYTPDITPQVSQSAAQVWSDLREETDGEIGPRKGDAIIRLAIASARLHRREEVSIEDVKAARDLIVESLKQIGDGDIDGTVLSFGELEEQSECRKRTLQIVQEDGPIKEDDLLFQLNKYPEETASHYIDHHFQNGNFVRTDEGKITAT